MLSICTHFSMRFVKIIATNVYKLTKCVLLNTQIIVMFKHTHLVHRARTNLPPEKKARVPRIQLKCQGFDPLTHAYTLANHSHHHHQINVLIAFFWEQQLQQKI